MTDAENSKINPYNDLSQPVLDQIISLNKSASRLTTGMIVSVFIPAGFLFVIGLGILRIVQAKKLCQQLPILKDPESLFPGKTKADMKILAMTSPNLRKVIEFSAARKAYWIAVLFPFILVGGLLGLTMYFK